MSDLDVLSFYENLADEYHLLFADWRQSVARQGEILEGLMLGLLGRRPATILDCSCGIGTQALGLAGRGYRVHATDLSPRAVERAAREARRMGVPLSTGVADFRTLDARVEGTFDVVLTFDNALPHLLTDEELTQAARAMRSKLAPGGLFLASVRDYDALARERPRFDSGRVMEGPDGRRVTFQVWDWSEDGRTYQVNQFVVRQTGSRWDTHCHSGTYRALRREELHRAFSGAGFTDLRWHTPEQSGFYQPVVSAR
jgi:glycine/sarcosine N-methyltransferase